MQCEILIFVDGQSTYAIDLNEVKEIVNLRRLTPLPFAAPFLLGLASVRGNMVPVVSTHLLTRGRGRYIGDVEYAAVVDWQGVRIAIACQRIVGVRNLDAKLPSSDGLVTPLKFDGKRYFFLDTQVLGDLSSEAIKDDRYTL